jgi:2-polyprenyl-3-methyl-5-hydroxy-6-metoxy-1,4-benzoquinol methylase
MQETAFTAVPIEEVQSYWDRRPCNTRQYFDEVEARKYFVEPHIPGFADFKRWAGKRVLEIGCGLGTDTINFARAGATVTAVDLSRQSLNLAAARAKVFGLDDRIDFHHGNSEHLSDFVVPQVFDLVYSFGVIHHTPHPSRVIDQIKKFVVPGSELRIMLYSRVSYKLFRMMRDENMWDMSRLDELIARNSEAQTGCPVTYTYCFDDVRQLLTGFNVLELTKAHIFTWDIDAYKRHEYKRDPDWEHVSDAELRRLESELGWHTLARAVFAG